MKTRVLMLLALLTCTPHVACGEEQEIAKTFYFNFDDSTVITGMFVGSLDTDTSTLLATADLSYLTVNIYTAKTGEPQSATWEYVDPQGSLGPFGFKFNTSFETIYFSNGLTFWSPGPGATSQYWTYHWFSAGQYIGGGFSVIDYSISDIGTGVNYGGLEADILLGLYSGLIDNSGMANSLLTMLEAAGSADGKENAQAAGRILDAFIHRVEAQSGKTIDPWMADLLIEDALTVIESLL